MPKGNALRDLTKQTWDNYLNADYKCPILWEGLENELFPDEGLGEMHETCDNKHPESSEWVWWETPSFFLFQDQHDAEEYHRKGTVLKLKATGEEKEFTVMSGSINEKVQMLQVCAVPMCPCGSCHAGAPQVSKFSCVCTVACARLPVCSDLLSSAVLTDGKWCSPLHSPCSPHCGAADRLFRPTRG